MQKTKNNTGDDGLTSLASNQRIKKHSDLIELYGCVEELNVHLGYAAECLCQAQESQDMFKKIYKLQRELFELGTHLLSGNRITINPHQISKLEAEIDVMSKSLPILKSFLPSGGEQALRIHLARTVCRRAERIAFKLAESIKDAEIFGIYFNRLGDWLFACARTAALIANIEEVGI